LKLLTKTNIYSSVATIILFIIGIFVVFNFIFMKFDSEQDEQLLSAKKIIIESLKKGKTPEQFSSNIGEIIAIRKIKAQTSTLNYFKEYEIQKGQDYAKIRELNFQCLINENAYGISVSISLSQDKKIGEYIFAIVTIYLFISLFILFLLNRYISSHIFSPFYDTLSKIKKWNIKKNDPLTFKKTNIDEFNLINITVQELTQQIKTDYKNLKEFTENVSHESQTPLSIISSKLELLMQGTNYNAKQQEYLQQIFQSTQRIYKLNQVLILMSRIENKQFLASDSINLQYTIQQKIDELEDFISAKQIIVSPEFKTQTIKNINPILFDILLNNLMINAIKYNLEQDGVIIIRLDEHTLTIENTSDIGKIEKEFLFERFTKSSTSSSLGVGLSLIKKIIEAFNWQITYSHKNNIHTFKIYL
jgi:signal transduction histidine kinase